MKFKAKIFSIVCLSILFLGNSKNLLAQHDHGSHGDDGHKPTPLVAPHGGQLKDVGKYTIELVTNMLSKKNQLTFYIYKGNMKQMRNEEISGTISFVNPDGTSSNYSLTQLGYDSFVAQLKEKNGYKCSVTFLIKGKEVFARFMHDGIEGSTTNGYTCTMHPEIKSYVSGICPICELDLVPKKVKQKPKSDGHGHDHSH